MYFTSSLSALVLLASTAAATGTNAAWYLKVHTIEPTDQIAFTDSGYFITPPPPSTEKQLPIGLKNAKYGQGWENALWSFAAANHGSDEFFLYEHVPGETVPTNPLPLKGIAGDQKSPYVFTSLGSRAEGQDWLKFRRSFAKNSGDDNGNVYIAKAHVDLWLCTIWHDNTLKTADTGFYTKDMEPEDPQKRKCQKAVIYAHKAEIYKQNFKDIQALWKTYRNTVTSVDESRSGNNLDHDSKAMIGEGFKMEEEKSVPQEDEEQPWMRELVDDLRADEARADEFRTNQLMADELGAGDFGDF